MTQLRWRAFDRFRWVWKGWERLMLRLYPVSPIRPGSLFAFHVRGEVVELHLDGAALARLREAPGYSAFKAIHVLRGDMAELADRIRRGEPGGVKVLKGSGLVGEAAPILGFHARLRAHTLGAALQQYFFVGLDAIYVRGGVRRRAMQRWPVDVWMTVDELLRLYPPKSDRSTAAR